MMPTTIPAMAPVPRRELWVVEDFESDKGDGDADAVEAIAPIPRPEPLVDEGFEIDKVEKAADAVEALDVSRDAEMDV